jgi:predicted component of type VI protein secretion system
MMTDTPTLPALVGLGPGPTTGLRLVLGDHRLVGRSVDCDLRLTEDQVGARHAVLSRHDGRTWVQDLGTPGGTFVNGQRLGGSAHPLRRGDVVVFGTVALRVSAEADPHRPAATPPRPPLSRPPRRPPTSPPISRPASPGTAGRRGHRRRCSGRSRRFGFGPGG